MPPTIAEQEELLVRLVKEDPTRGRRKLIEMTGFSRHRVEKFLREFRAGTRAAANSTLREPGSYGTPVRTVSVNQFVSRYDYAGMIRNTLNKLCRKAFISDSSMRIESGIPVTAYRAVADLPEFRECQVKSHDGIWWSLESNTALVRKETQKWGISR